MKYYTYRRGFYKSPIKKYFNTIAELNDYYGIGSNPSDYNKGYRFNWNGKTYYLGADEEDN